MSDQTDGNDETTDAATAPSESVPRPTVLFVDDEPFILDGLRRTLRHRRNLWNMEFIEGGKAALDRIAAGPFDVIVSDMRMPDVDGAAVLEAAATEHPESLRYILTGYADKEYLLRALGPAQRFFAKPCDAAEIAASIEKALTLRTMLPTEALRELMGRLKSVPVPSDTYYALLQQLDSPTASAKSVGAVLEEDLGLTTQILRLSNSAYFGLPKRLTRAQEAVEMLGMESIRALLTVAEFFLLTPLSSALADECKKLAERSMRIGGYARKFAQRHGMDPDIVTHAATAGLLSHIGSLVLQVNEPNSYARAMRYLDQHDTSVGAVERAMFGATHSELSAYLVAVWGFADPVVEAIAFHHHPAKAGPPERGALCAVHVAQAMAGADTGGEDAALFVHHGHEPVLDWDYLDALGLGDPLRAELGQAQEDG
ncbi:HDOD domain-containing protein [Rhodospirillaceae bacterium KN72]|uniref:HDOD domain-containing protein n=1 Tax=Pacificispira spongiicola TaxID=2729598 RepID=A0A7Y0HH65_9PROT|nr:HDOD domain-containing protein [Pacificispira spongiicola]NMM45622.1 HDOD domain-containing protein [Pacificispira spongiicola]